MGQQHLLGPGRILRKIIDGGGRLPSLILWAGPGTGKTALDAAVLANLPDATGRRTVTEETLAESLGRAPYTDDKGGSMTTSPRRSSSMRQTTAREPET